MLPRSRGAIGRVRAAPGALPTAGGSVDGPDAPPLQSPVGGKGLTPSPPPEIAMADRALVGTDRATAFHNAFELADGPHGFGKRSARSIRS